MLYLCVVCTFICIKTTSTHPIDFRIWCCSGRAATWKQLVFKRCIQKSNERWKTRPLYKKINQKKQNCSKVCKKINFQEKTNDLYEKKIFPSTLHTYTHTHTNPVHQTSHHKEKHYHHHRVLTRICSENLFKVFLLYTR